MAVMQHHFGQVTLIHEAVIRGDLPSVRAPAMELAYMPIPPGTLTTAVPFVVAISAAARRAAEATDLASAAAATGSILRQCGECHRAVGVMPSPPVAVGPDVAGVVGHMLEHQRAIDELLNGLLIPSASQWSRGAERLRVAPLKSGDLPPDPALTGNLKRADARVHQIAEQAVLARSPLSRAAAYGDLLTTCAECHGLHRRIWGPRRGF